MVFKTPASVLVNLTFKTAAIHQGSAGLPSQSAAANRQLADGSVAATTTLPPICVPGEAWRTLLSSSPQEQARDDTRICDTGRQ
ncbi:hypothetical protein MTO96_001422 [Rhipicephalus appendiculatus]